jgi:hypothetical protein
VPDLKSDQAAFAKCGHDRETQLSASRDQNGPRRVRCTVTDRLQVEAGVASGGIPLQKHIIMAAGLLAASLFLAPAPASALPVGVAAVPEAAAAVEQVQYGYGRGYGRRGYGYGRGYGRRGYGYGPRYGGRGYGYGRGYGRVGPGNALSGGIGIVRGPGYYR